MAVGVVVRVAGGVVRVAVGLALRASTPHTPLTHTNTPHPHTHTPRPPPTIPGKMTALTKDHESGPIDDSNSNFSNSNSNSNTLPVTPSASLHAWDTVPRLRLKARALLLFGALAGILCSRATLEVRELLIYKWML